ncbi:uncharacterized protein LOC144166070 [Haemaphysalis longicornis]
MAKTKSGKQGFPNVIGCIDGCHVEIPKPAVSEHSYCNRKKYHSILLQGICNERKEFFDVFSGYPGYAHDALVLKKSFFYEDAAAKCAGFAQRKEDFNRLHRQQRVTIEGAFGLLKNPFQRLFYVNAPSIKQAVLTIIGACLLHNLCIYAPVTMTTPRCSQQGWMFLFLTKTATFSPVWETSRTK